MRPYLTLPLILIVAACQPRENDSPQNDPATPETTAAESAETPAPVDLTRSVVRINSTQQSWNPWQPWEKNPPRKRRALAAIVRDQRIVTTAELVADATYLEFESPDGTRFCPAKVVAVDYEANFALLGPQNDEEGAAFFQDTQPFEINQPLAIGSKVEILQVEENGTTIQTPGTLQSVDLLSNFLPGASFLTYRVKASMQSAASSYSLPVLHNGKLAGVLISYDSKDQISDVAATDILTRFLKEATNGDYAGSPSLGTRTARTEDASFRKWLKLTDDQGGLYVKSVRKGSSAETAGVKKDDVIIAIDGKPIDRRGYFEHPSYGKLLWGHLIRGEKSTGDTVALSLIRDGRPIELEATLTRLDQKDKLVPTHLIDQAPNYLIKGGLVFLELTRPYLSGFGDKWSSRAPINLLDPYYNPENFEDSINRVVFLSGVIPTPATVGYEPLRNAVIVEVNGTKITDMKSLIAAFDNNTGGLHSIKLEDDDLTIYLDDNEALAVDNQLIQRGIPRLSRAE